MVVRRSIIRIEPQCFVNRDDRILKPAQPVVHTCQVRIRDELWCQPQCLCEGANGFIQSFELSTGSAEVLVTHWVGWVDRNQLARDFDGLLVLSELRKDIAKV